MLQARPCKTHHPAYLPKLQAKLVHICALLSGLNLWIQTYLGGRFGYFLFFSALGGGRGSPRRREVGGIDFLLKIPQGGGSPGGGGPRGREGVCGKLGNWGGGAKFFFFWGRNIHQDTYEEPQVTNSMCFSLTVCFIFLEL